MTRRKIKYQQRHPIPTIVFIKAQSKLEPADNEVIERNVKRLMTIRNVGADSALEILARIGMWLVLDEQGLLNEVDDGRSF